jgi:hypothetical protein
LRPVRNPRYSAGKIDLHVGRRLYINRGLGHCGEFALTSGPK